MSNSSIWHMDRTLSCSVTPNQSVFESNGNEGVSAFPKALALQEPQHQCHIQDTRWSGRSYPTAEIQSVHSTALADWSKQFMFCLLRIEMLITWKCRCCNISAFFILLFFYLFLNKKCSYFTGGSNKAITVIKPRWSGMAGYMKAQTRIAFPFRCGCSLQYS